MKEKVPILKLDDMLSTENENSELFLLPEGTTFNSVYAFASAHPDFPISALVLRGVTENLIEPSKGPAVLTTRILSIAEAKQAIRNTYSDAHRTRMRFVSSERVNELTNALLISAEKPEARIVEISENGKIVGLLMYRPLEYLGEIVNLTSWIWRDENLDEGSRRSFRHMVYSILKKQPYRYTVAMVHLANRQSMRHFEKLGLSPLCVAKFY